MKINQLKINCSAIFSYTLGKNKENFQKFSEEKFFVDNFFFLSFGFGYIHLPSV